MKINQIINEGLVFYAKNPDGTKTYSLVKDAEHLANLEQKYRGAQVQKLDFARQDVQDWLDSRGVNLRRFPPGMETTVGPNQGSFNNSNFAKKGMPEDAEPMDREFALVKKLGRLGERVVQNPKLWDRYDQAVDNDDIDWIIGLIQDGTGATVSEVSKLADLFGEIGGGLGRIVDFAWAVKEGTWDEDFMNPYRAHRSQDLNEFSFDKDGGDDGGDDPYKYPQPEHYSRSIDFFGQFEADHFDDEVFDEATGEFRGYWDDQEGRDQIAYFKFDNPRRTGDDDPGMGWYYEPQNESVAEGDPQLQPGMQVKDGTIVKVNGNTVTIKTSNGDLMNMNIHDVDVAQNMAEGPDDSDDYYNLPQPYGDREEEFPMAQDTGFDVDDEYDDEQGMAEGQRMGEYGRVLSALGLYVPDKFSMEELNTPDWHRVIASKADVPVEYAGKVIDDFTRPVDGHDDDEWPEDDEQGMAEGSLEEIDRRGFLKGLGAAAAAGTASQASAGLPLFVPVPNPTQSDPPLKLSLRLPWKHKHENLTKEDQKIIANLIHILYLARMAEQQDLYQLAYTTISEINDAFADVDIGKSMNFIKKRLENAQTANPNQFDQLSKYFLNRSVYDKIIASGKKLATDGPGAVTQEPQQSQSAKTPPKTFETMMIDRMLRLYFYAKQANDPVQVDVMRLLNLYNMSKNASAQSPKDTINIPERYNELQKELSGNSDIQERLSRQHLANAQQIMAEFKKTFAMPQQDIDQQSNKTNEQGVAEGKPREKEADYGDDYQAMVARVKKLAGLGPLKTVYDPQKRVYKNVPTAVQPKKEQR